MAITQPKSEKLGVLMIGFSPVIREGLQAIMTKDSRLNVVGDVRMDMTVFCLLNEYVTGDRL